MACSGRLIKLSMNGVHVCELAFAPKADIVATLFNFRPFYPLSVQICKTEKLCSALSAYCMLLLICFHVCLLCDATDTRLSHQIKDYLHTYLSIYLLTG